MTGEEMERAIKFLIEHHAKVSADIERNSEQIAELSRNTEAMRAEMREGFENLIIANEVTRKLSEDVARLALQNSQRITSLEEKAS